MQHYNAGAAPPKSEGWFIPPIVVPIVLLLAVLIYALVGAQ